MISKMISLVVMYVSQKNLSLLLWITMTTVSFYLCVCVCVRVRVVSKGLLVT